jgi:hypothetical protein
MKPLFFGQRRNGAPKMRLTGGPAALVNSRVAPHSGVAGTTTATIPVSVQGDKSALKKNATELLSARDARISIINPVWSIGLTAAAAKPLLSASYPRSCESWCFW